MVNIERVYAPGACNISREEGALRLAMGLVGTGLTVAAALAFFALNLSPWLKLTLFFPATLAASGYLQASLKFCMNYGLRGVYNTDGELGHTTKVDDAAKAVDKRRALIIFGWSAAIGAVVAIAAALI